MRCYLGKDGIDITARFRAGGCGPTVVAARISVPLRWDDLVSILYGTRLSGAALTDADQVREHVLDVLINHGGRAIAAGKTALESAILTGTVDVERLAACQRRITALYGFPPGLCELHNPPVIARQARPRAA